MEMFWLCLTILLSGVIIASGQNVKESNADILKSWRLVTASISCKEKNSTEDVTCFDISSPDSSLPEAMRIPERAANNDISLQILVDSYKLEWDIVVREARKYPGKIFACANGDDRITKRTGNKGFYCILSSHGCGGSNNHNLGSNRKRRSALESAPELVYTFIEQAVQPGAHISLKCSAAGEPPPRFSWNLDSLPVSQNHRISIGESGEGGGYTIAQLNITNVRVEDGGLYTCQVANSRGKVQHSARLNVYGPPYIRSIGTIKAVTGTDINLVCPYYGFPISSVKWESINGKELTSSRVSTSDGTLQIRNVDPITDAGGYICEVRSPGGELARREIRLHVASPPSLSPLLSMPDLKAGHRTQLTCTVTSGDMPVHFAWFKDSAPISSVLQLEERTADFFSLLLFKSLSASHGGTYTCVATNAAGSANISTELHIKVPPWWRAEPTDVSVLLGSAINIPCEAKGHPLPIVQWTKLEGGVEVSVGAWDVEPSISSIGGTTMRGASSRSSGTLVVAAARTTHAGQYICRASNGVPPDLVKTITVTVHEPARFESASQNVSAVRGTNVRLICSALGESPLQIVWSRSGRPLPRQDYRMSISETSGGGGMRSQLTIERAERRDSGLYRCQASNAFGRSEHFIHLAVQEPPEPPSDLRVSDVTSRSVRVSWRRPYDGNSGVAGYTIQYRQIPLGDTRVDDTWEGSDVHNISVAVGDMSASEGYEEHGSISGLTPGTSYIIRIFARSPLFASPPSTSTIANTRSEPPTSPPHTPRVLSHAPAQFVVEWQPPPKTTWNGEITGYIVSWWIVTGTSMESKSNDNYNSYPSYNSRNSKIRGPNNQYNDGNGLYVGEIARNTDIAGSNGEFSRTYTSNQYNLGSFGDYQRSNAEHATIRGPGNTKYVIVGLEHFTRYAIVVKAFNGAGVGPGSVATVAMTQESVPSAAPLDIRCRALSSQSLKVEWSPPPEHKLNGALLGYKLIYRPVSPKDFLDWHRQVEMADMSSFGGAVEVKRIPALETQLLALKKAQNYSIQVLAYTSPGDGAVSSVIYCTTEDDVPGRPADVKAIPLSATSLFISWLPPERTNGFVTHYTIYYREVGSSNSASSQRVTTASDQETEIFPLIGIGGSLELRKLNERAHYEIWATASGAAGESEHSRHVTQATNSRAPARLSTFGLIVIIARGVRVRLACAAKGAAQVRWTRRPRAQTRIESGEQPNLIIDGAEPNHSGNYTCQASNVFGSDEITYQITSVRLPYPPVLSLQYSSRDSVRVLWRNEENAVDILGYTIRYWQVGTDGHDRSEIAIGGEATGYTLRGLACYVTYSATLAVHTTRGDSPFGKILQVSTTDNADLEQLARTAIWSNSTSLIIDTRSVLRSERSSCIVRLLRLQYRRADIRDEWKDAHISEAHETGEVSITGIKSGAWWAIRIWAAPPAPSPPRAYTLFAHTTTMQGEPVPRPAHFPLDANEATSSDGAILTDAVTSSSNTLTVISATLASVALISSCAVIYILIKKKNGIWSCSGDAIMSESRDCVAVSVGGDGKSCSGDSRGCHDYSAAPRHKLTPEDEIYEISPYATFQVGGASTNTPGNVSTAATATLDHSLQFRTFGHRENEDVPHCRRHGRSRTPRDHYDKHRVDCELQQLSRYEKFQPRHRIGGSYCVPLAHQASQATASLSEVYAGESSADSTSPPRGHHS